VSIELFFVFLFIGKLVMFLARKSPYFRWGDFLKQLFDCELCLGVWTYTAMAFGYHFYIFEGIGYIPIFSEFLTGSVMSFVMWLITEGWNAKFREIHINME